MKQIPDGKYLRIDGLTRWIYTVQNGQVVEVVVISTDIPETTKITPHN